MKIATEVQRIVIGNKYIEGGAAMRNVASLSFMAVAILGLTMLPAFAQAPPTNPNGFPSGDHYNLNIVGKKAGFVCPSQEYDADGQPIYGNVVFVPEWGDGDIWLMSGSGRKSTGFSTLAVTDPCVTAIDSDPAEVQIPALPDGYWVYARALGKLIDDPLNPLSMTISPGIVSVSSTDETLVYLGYVTSTGFYAAPSGVTITRIKGKHPAIPINTLFDWQGYVCYDVDPATFGLTGYTNTTDQCLADTNGDGVQEIVGQPVGGVCAEGTLTAGLWCKYYDTNWIFNIADFVNYLLGTTNDGSKLVQIRLYPR